MADSIIKIEERDIVKAIQAGLTDILPEVLQAMEDEIKSVVDGLIEGQQAENSYSHEYNISGDTVEGTITFELGQIQGSYESQISKHSREGGSVKSHTRTYQNKRPFQLPDGSWITSETIPQEVIEAAIEKPVQELIDNFDAKTGKSVEADL